MKTEQKNDCPVCSSNAVELVLEITDIPTYCNVLWPSKQTAVAAKQGDIQLSFCKDCGHQLYEHFP